MSISFQENVVYTEQNSTRIKTLMRVERQYQFGSIKKALNTEVLGARLRTQDFMLRLRWGEVGIPLRR